MRRPGFPVRGLRPEDIPRHLLRRFSGPPRDERVLESVRGIRRRRKETSLRRRLRKKKGEGPFPTVVLVGRDGDLALPVEILSTSENGQTTGPPGTARRGDPTDVALRDQARESRGDPDRKVISDRDLWNNVRVTGGSGLPPPRSPRHAFHLVEILSLGVCGEASPRASLGKPVRTAPVRRPGSRPPSETAASASSGSGSSLGRSHPPAARRDHRPSTSPFATRS
jgi:hypothetical protein